MGVIAVPSPIGSSESLCFSVSVMDNSSSMVSFGFSRCGGLTVFSCIMEGEAVRMTPQWGQAKCFLGGFCDRSVNVRGSWNILLHSGFGQRKATGEASSLNQPILFNTMKYSIRIALIATMVSAVTASNVYGNILFPLTSFTGFERMLRLDKNRNRMSPSMYSTLCSLLYFRQERRRHLGLNPLT